VRAEARKYTMHALKTLLHICIQPRAPASARVAAAEALLDRGWGKATQILAGDPENPLTVVHEVVRRIVRPEDIAMLSAQGGGVIDAVPAEALPAPEPGRDPAET
jgi:hypothetical protein